MNFPLFYFSSFLPFFLFLNGNLESLSLLKFCKEVIIAYFYPDIM